MSLTSPDPAIPYPEARRRLAEATAHWRRPIPADQLDALAQDWRRAATGTSQRRWSLRLALGRVGYYSRQEARTQHAAARQRGEE